MLGKLLKHEFKSVGKVLAVVNLVIIIITFIGCIMLNLGVFDSTTGIFVASFLITFYALSLAGFAFATLIYLYVRFYRNLFSAEGYLMHTLPVTSTQLFHSKLLVGYFWAVVNGLLIILSLVALGYAAIYHASGSVNDIYIMQFFEENGMLISMVNGQEVRFSFHDIFGYTPVQFLLLIIVMQLIGSFSSLLMGYLSILLGQLVEKHKLGAAIGFYFAIYVGHQIISSIIMLLPNLRFIFLSAATETVSTNFLFDYFGGLFKGAIITQLVLGLIFYLVSFLLMRRKVNLD